MAESSMKLPVTLALTMAGMLIGGALSFAGKADQKEVDDIKKEMSVMRENAREESTIQKNILSLLDRMDKRMERIENKQDYMIHENNRRWNGDQQPPSSTPAPNPLNQPK